MTDSTRLAAQELYRNALVWDDHSGFMPHPSADLSQLRLWREAGVHYLSVDVGFDLLPWEHTVKTLAAFRHWILAHPKDYALVSTVQDIHRARSEQKLAVTFDIEGMNALDGRIEMIEAFYRLGVRQILFAYNRGNQAGGGCHDEDQGLTPFGRAAIDEMNRLGMFVDVSHCSHRTSLEAIEYSKEPVIFSHSNAWHLCRHERNIRDDQIKGCAAKGGIVGAVGLNRFLGNADAGTEALADHIEYLLDIAGLAHVGIGLDYSFPVDNAATDRMFQDNPHFWPPDRGYADVEMRYVEPRALVDLVGILLRRGRTESVIRGVLGENFLRLAGKVWR
jgi:membrane dipeptidase